MPDCDAMTSWGLVSYVLVSPYVHTHTRVRMFDVDVHREPRRCAAARGVLCLDDYGGALFEGEGRVRKKAKARWDARRAKMWTHRRTRTGAKRAAIGG